MVRIIVKKSGNKLRNSLNKQGYKRAVLLSGKKAGVDAISIFPESKKYCYSEM